MVKVSFADAHNAWPAAGVVRAFLDDREGARQGATVTKHDLMAVQLPPWSGHAPVLF